jgi:ribonuclease P protein component
MVTGNEENISTKQYQKETGPRLSGSHEQQGRKARVKEKKGKGEKAADRLSGVGPLTREQDFPKSHRLLKRSDFARRAEGVERLGTQNFAVIQVGNSLGIARLGIVVNRKVGNAVTRNRIKRLVREFFRLNRQSIDAGKDIIVIANKGARIGAFWDVEMELRKVLVCGERMSAKPSGFVVNS